MGEVRNYQESNERLKKHIILLQLDPFFFNYIETKQSL